MLGYGCFPQAFDIFWLLKSGLGEGPIGVNGTLQGAAGTVLHHQAHLQSLAERMAPAWWGHGMGCTFGSLVYIKDINKHC